MNTDNVLDLDLLKPKERIVKIGGKKIDVSFIPCGITFEVDAIIKEMQNFKVEKLEEGGKETKAAFDLTLKLCAVFCSVKNPELNEKWFRENTSPSQIQLFAEAIRESLLSGFEAVEAHSKNG